MAWLPDEIHDFYEDCKDKKSTAQSARHARTHCGKGGSVKFASDYMTKKEREAMNGECKSYRMNEPISWEEFKTWPDEHKVTYIKLLRAKYNATDSAISEMLGIDRTWFKKMIIDRLKLTAGKRGASKWDKEGFYAWWHGVKGDAVQPSETPVEEEDEDDVEATVDSDVAESEQEATDEPEIVCVSLEEELGKEKADIVEELLAEVVKVIEDDTCDREKMIRDAGPIAFAGNSVPVIPSRGTLTFDNNAADDALSTIKTLLGNMRVSMTITWFPAE